MCIWATKEEVRSWVKLQVHRALINPTQQIFAGNGDMPFLCLYL